MEPTYAVQVLAWTVVWAGSGLAARALLARQALHAAAARRAEARRSGR